ncbi:class I SAM-dependent methyltransferase [Terrabacter sp. NPDC080008]|uniref:class I SAM-dependent methyltransferase n=1 Tax=Terrabacter sp. NPDC080008 TaxID=3155176 RepID=UPI00344C9404
MTAADPSSELLATWTEAWTTEHAGWDFSDVATGMSEGPTPWDFDAECVRALRAAGSVLDMGTGGGEQLLRLLDAVGPAADGRRVVATEGWPPNVPVARAALEPRGVEVVEHDADRCVPLPLADGSVDLVTNRHEAYDPADLARLLAPGGVLLTQQVGSRDAEQAREWFGTPAPRTWTLERAAADLEQAGIVVEDSADAVGVYRFDSVRVLLRYFSHVPWDLPVGFRPEDHVDVLGDLHARAGRGEPIEMTHHRWWLRAVRR